MLIRFFIFLVLNFLALAIAGYYTGPGVPSTWYVELNKAPWTPPGWLFGVAWTTIMICYAFYMAFLWKMETNKFKLMSLYSLQWLLNVAWSPLFFARHQVGLGLLVLTSLTVLLVYVLFVYNKRLKLKSMFIFPYVLWLCIATSLNGYIWWMN